MSYARLGENSSQVYVYDDCTRGLTCMWCLLVPGAGNFHTRSVADMADHLTQHRAAGHVVPPDVEREIREDHPDGICNTRTG